MLKRVLYSIWGVVLLIFVLFTANSTMYKNFLDVLENRTFDLRQNMIVNSGYKTPNKDIVIVSVDDASYEYILDKYGEWPLSREVYADIITYLENQNPQAIAFDMMFVKSIKSDKNADSKLADAFAKYKNLYTAMNLDNQSIELRTPPELPAKLSINVINNSDINFNDLTFQNCRLILNEIINKTANIGMINVSRADDGILRKMPVFVRYKDKYYPQLALKVGLNLLYKKENLDKFTIDKNSRVIFNDRKIFLDNDGSAILNWYGSAGAYERIPIYKLIKAVNKEQPLEYNFTNKIVYFGTTASSLFDIKTTPVEKVYPGVEVQATYLNNLIDNNFITKADQNLTLVISVIMAIAIGLIVINITSIMSVILSFLSIYTLYLIVTYYAMKYHNLWLDWVSPVILGLIVFISAFIVKYFIKSRDFDQQYLLATTDGLTELYNHRYFQEQMKISVENSKRYNMPFSLIIIDIDFFKKFNDTYGHQAGDTILRQVAILLKHSVRATDIVCRYGGEEMSIILPNTNKEMAYATASKICKKVGTKKFRPNNTQESNVTISLGVATFPDDGTTASEIIEIADKRLYKSKNNGRNQVN